MFKGLSLSLRLRALLLNYFIPWFVLCQMQENTATFKQQICVKQVDKCYVDHNNVG